MLMALGGARHDTELELIKSLRLEKHLNNQNSNWNENEKRTAALRSLHESVRQLLQLITMNNNNSAVEPGVIVLANRLVLNEQTVEPAFLHTIQTTYKAEVDSVGANESLASLIDRTNKWSNETTNGKIDKILADEFRLASLALINIIYFNKEWKIQFDEKLTAKEKFYLTADRQRFTQVDMMKLSGKSLAYVYSSKLAAHLVSLPYNDDKFVFNIVLPSNENDFLLNEQHDSVLNQLNYVLLKEELDKQEHEKVDLEIPKFSIKKTMKVNC
jgi:serine protease inhibitor